MISNLSHKNLASFLLLTLLAGCGHPEKQVVEVNKTIVAKEPDTYMQVRHIVLRGTNQEIGKAIGEIAQEWLQIQPIVRKDDVFTKANNVYLKHNYSLLVERMKGVAQAYHKDVAELYGGLFYDLWPTACSIIYFPPQSTEDGHALLAHNYDWRPETFSETVGLPAREGERNGTSRNFVMELYPTDGGYASIVVGSMDLLNGLLDGMNSRGLAISILHDPNCPTTTEMQDLAQACGLTPLQLARLILDTCATVEQAEIVFLCNKMVFSFEGVHFLVADATGKSVICEIDPKLGTWHFSENDGKPQIMTNHPQYLYQDSSTFPASEDTYNTFNRYRKLEEFVAEHLDAGHTKISRDDADAALQSVFGRAKCEVGVSKKKRFITMWTEVYDLTSKTLEVAFYLKDGACDSKTGERKLGFTSLFTFALK